MSERDAFQHNLTFLTQIVAPMVEPSRARTVERSFLGFHGVPPVWGLKMGK